MEPRLEFGAVVPLEREDAEWETLSDLVQESDRRALIAPVIDLQDPDSGAVIDGRELVELLAGAWDSLEELHIHLQAVPGLGFLVSLPTFSVRLMLLIGR